MTDLNQCQCTQSHLHPAEGCQNAGELLISQSLTVCTDCYDNGHVLEPFSEEIIEAHKDHGGAAGLFESCPLCWEMVD